MPHKKPQLRSRMARLRRCPCIFFIYLMKRDARALILSQARSVASVSSLARFRVALRSSSFIAALSMYHGRLAGSAVCPPGAAACRTARPAGAAACRAAGIAGADFAAVGRAAWFARAAGASARISASTAGVAGNSPRIIAARLAPLVASIVNSGPTGGGLGPLKRRCSAISRARSLPSSGARFGRSLSSEAPRRAASLTCSASSSRSFCSVRRAARLAVMCSIVAALLELLRSSCSARTPASLRA